MISSSILAVALAGAAIAFTPSGFTPSSTQNMSVIFGNTLAINGKEMQKAGEHPILLWQARMLTSQDVATAPTLGTASRMFGTYAVMMVDPDVPSGPGNSTSQLLHWMQAGFVSSNTSTTIAGVTTFELINPNNSTAFATYIQPSPPNKAPNTHRYTQLLLNTTGNTSALTTLAKFAMTRTNFSAANVINMAQLKIVAGNSFDVSNGTLVQSNITKTTSPAAGGAGATATGTKTATSTGTQASQAAGGNTTNSGTNSNSSATTTSPGTAKATAGATDLNGGAAYIAGFGALAAAVLML